MNHFHDHLLFQQTPSEQQDTSVLNMGPGKSNQEDFPEQLELPFSDEAGGDSDG